MSERWHDVVVIPGDGIGPELTEAALAVLGAAGERFGFGLRTEEVRAGAAVYQEEGVAISPAGVERVRAADATLKGPVGLPGVRTADGTEAGLLGGVLRVGLDLYANVRPVRLLPGVPARLAAEPDSIDYVIVRENTEGLYLSRGRGVGNDQVMTDTLLVTRAGCERIARFAFELAGTRDGAPAGRIRRVTLVDKANVLRTMWFFRQVFLAVAAGYPDVEAECLHVDAAAEALVMRPEHFDVIVTENMFGDILSDLGGGTVGGIAMCPSGNVGARGAYFEPIHGSAPALAGRGLANPLGQILAGAMMLDHLGERPAAAAVRAGVRAALASRAIELRTDGTAVGGPAAVTAAVAEAQAGVDVGGG